MQRSVSLEKIAVLASGGLDSSVLVAEMAGVGEVYPIYVRCGLAWEEPELKGLCAFLDALNNPSVRPVTVLLASTAPMYGDHWSVSGVKVPGADEPDEAVFIPGRNIILIGMAAVWCSTHDVSRITIGSLGGNPFPDATPEFFESFARVLSIGLGKSVRIDAPWKGMHKDAIIGLFEDLPLELTMTCMAPKGEMHCGRCNKCFERQEAFKKAGIVDRTSYVA